MASEQQANPSTPFPEMNLDSPGQQMEFCTEVKKKKNRGKNERKTQYHSNKGLALAFLRLIYSGREPTRLADMLSRFYHHASPSMRFSSLYSRHSITSPSIFAFWQHYSEQ
ncbi:unnamed protein product [Polarella glacialis]|uniref:Uncharacterized protein n=1 Tax=Polarella glacialis TaxID=89957 RepID=A0A813FGD4_POLGL|nr:unnamed protein product [Polarella glacialis]CAE8742395.1 unnamed protein product [Polarella glacialis]